MEEITIVATKLAGTGFNWKHKFVVRGEGVKARVLALFQKPRLAITNAEFLALLEELRKIGEVEEQKYVKGYSAAHPEDPDVSYWPPPRD